MEKPSRHHEAFGSSVSRLPRCPSSILYRRSALTVTSAARYRLGWRASRRETCHRQSQWFASHQAQGIFFLRSAAKT